MDNDTRQEHYAVAQKLLAEQNFAAAMIGGAVATVLAALAFSLVVPLWPYSYGFAIAGLGIVIGLPMGFLGRGISAKYAVAASLFTIAAYALGNAFTVILRSAQRSGRSLGEIFRDISFAELVDPSIGLMSMSHLVYLFVAVVAAGFLARRSLSRSQRLAISLYEMRR